MNLFAKPKTTKEVLKENKREIKHSSRDIEREVQTLEREEKRVVFEIKKLAKAGQNASAKTMAKELIRIRKQKEKLIGTKSMLNSVSTRATTMQAQEVMSKSMLGATHAMQVANQAMPMKQMQQTMMQYDKQNEMANMKEEMMDDIFEANDEEEEEANQTMDQVLDSIGLEIGEKMSTANPSKTPLSIQKEKEHDAKELDKLLSQMPSVH